MITGRAIIKIDRIKNIEIINRLLNESFVNPSFTWSHDTAMIEVENCDSFKQKLINLFSFQAQDLGIQSSVLIVPNFDKLFYKYLDYINNEVYTAFDLFVKKIDDPIIKQDMKKIYDSLDKNDIDTMVAFINCNMNSSLAASELYLHRNSMSYRINHFIMKTTIDIRDINSIMFLNLVFQNNR